MRTRAQRSDIDALEAVDGANGAAKPKAKARVRGTGKRASQKAKRAEVRVGEAAYEAPKDVTETIKPPTLRAKKTRSRIEDEQREEAQRPEEDVTEATIDETGKDGLGRGAESDDDDAPEEVSLSACKKAVENQQLLESEQKRLVKEQRKKRLRERDQLNEGASGWLTQNLLLRNQWRLHCFQKDSRLNPSSGACRTEEEQASGRWSAVTVPGRSEYIATCRGHPVGRNDRSSGRARKVCLLSALY